MTDNRVASDLHGRVHHDVLRQRVGVIQAARILGILSCGPEGVSTVVIEINHESVTLSKRHRETVHIPSVSGGTETFSVSIGIRNPDRGLVGRANRGRIHVQRDSSRSLVNLDRHESRNIGRTSSILIDDLHSILVTLNISSGYRDGVHIVDRIAIGGLLVILIPLILILGIVTDLIDNSLKDGIAALTNLLRSRNNDIRNRSDQERVDRRDNRGNATLAIDLNGELVGELLAIVFVDGINREGQMSRRGTGDTVFVKDILVVNQPLVGVTLKVVVNNSREGDDVVLAGSFGTGDVDLQVNHGTNRERFGNRNTAIFAGNRQGVNTITAGRTNSDVGRGLAVAPSVGVVTGRSHRRGDGGGGGVSSIVLVAAERNNRNLMNGDLIVISRGGEL